MSNQSNTKVKCTLRRVRLNQGGYDVNGSYWGLGNPLYWVSPEVPSFPEFPESDFFFRARDRSHAKAVVRARWPLATFFS